MGLSGRLRNTKSLSSQDINRMFQLMEFTNRIWVELCKSLSAEFENGMDKVADVQRDMLITILDANKSSEYGNKYDFEEIKSIQDYQKRVPVTVYEDYIPYISRVMNGEQAVLTSEPVIMLEMSSGSTAPSKYIPYTRSLKKQFLKGINPWVYNLYSNCRGLLNGRSYWSITPLNNKMNKTSGGIPVGFEEDSQYFGAIGRFLLDFLFAVPNEVKYIDDISAFRYVTLLFLLKERHLTFISVWNPTFLILLLKPFDEWVGDLINDLEKGIINSQVNISPGLNRLLSKRLGRNACRARELKSILNTFKNSTGAGSGSVYEAVWPGLKLISCWTDANAGVFIPELKSLFPNVEIQGKGLLSLKADIWILRGGHKMKIALLSPAGAMHRFTGSFKKPLHYAPITLTTLAALVPPELDAEVVIYDETAEKIPLDINADIIGITAITGTSMRAYRYADYFRRLGIPVVLGGVHPTLMPQEASMYADAVVVGLGEKSWPRLLKDFSQGSMQKFYYQDEDISIEGRPAPRRDLLKRDRYITLNSVEAVRGCTLPCTFCAYPAAFGRKLYKRPVREVIEEIEKLPGKEVLFPDVNLIADREYAIELFTGLIPLKRWWFGLVTSNIGTDEVLINLFRKSGCKGVLIGFESVTQDSQKYIQKGVNKVEGYEILVKRLHDAGIAINGCFAFGGDEDDKSVFERTVEAVVKLKIDLPRYSVLTPFPGTQFYKEMEEQGRIIERNWAMYDVEHCVFKPLKMTPDELIQGLEWAWKETYTYGSIAKRLGYLSTNLPISIPTNLAYRHYADRFSIFGRQVMVDNSDIPGGMGVENNVCITGNR